MISRIVIEKLHNLYDYDIQIPDEQRVSITHICSFVLTISDKTIGLLSSALSISFLRRI